MLVGERERFQRGNPRDKQDYVPQVVELLPEDRARHRFWRVWRGHQPHHRRDEVPERERAIGHRDTIW